MTFILNTVLRTIVLNTVLRAIDSSVSESELDPLSTLGWQVRCI